MPAVASHQMVMVPSEVIALEHSATVQPSWPSFGPS